MRLQFRNPKTGKFVKGDTSNLDKTFTKFGSNVIKQARGILSSTKKRASGTLYSDLSYNLKIQKAGLSFSLDFGRASSYWEFIDEGVQGIGGYTGNLSPKSRGRGSKFKFKYASPGGKLVEALKKGYGFSTSHAFGAGYNIKRRGLERTQFITKPLKEQYRKLPDELTKAFALDIEKLIDKAIPNKL